MVCSQSSLLKGIECRGICSLGLLGNFGTNAKFTVKNLKIKKEHGYIFFFPNEACFYSI